MSKGEEKKGLAIGAAIGAVAGVITGILFAPKSGKETRKDIKTAAEETVTRLEKEAKQVQSELVKYLSIGEKHVKTAGNTVSVKSKEALAKAKHSKDSLAGVVKAVKSGGADDKDLNKAVQEAIKAKDALKTYFKK